MAVTTTPTEVTVITGVNQVEKTQKRRRNNNNKKTSSDDRSCASLISLSSDSSSDCKPRRRRRRRSKGNNNKNDSQQQSNNRVEVQLSLEDQMKYVALDAEMVGVGYMGRKSSVARVTLVGWNGETIYDKFVKQDVPVTDYRTFVSGITESHLEDADLTLEECRQEVLELLDGKILVGHALKNDMKALSISHPWFMTRDTAKYEPFMQTRFDDGVLWPRKLKELAKLKLGREIQIVGEPHSPYEDAKAALDLYKKHYNKWEKAMQYKINKSQEYEAKKEVANE